MRYERLVSMWHGNGMRQELHILGSRITSWHGLVGNMKDVNNEKLYEMYLCVYIYIYILCVCMSNLFD